MYVCMYIYIYIWGYQRCAYAYAVFMGVHNILTCIHASYTYHHILNTYINTLALVPRGQMTQTSWSNVLVVK